MSRSRRRRRASTDQVAVVDRLEIEEVRPRRRGERSSTRRFRPLRWLFAAVTVAALLTAALPTVILRTDLKNRILPRAIPEFEGTIHIGDGTGGWISPLSLRDVVIRDETGKEVVRIDEVDSERNVWQLAQDAEDVGRLRLTRLWLAVEITESGSNLERLFAPFLEDDDDEDDDDDDDDSDTNVFIEIVDGKIDVSHPMAKQAWSVEGINLSADCPADIAQAVTGQLQAVVRRDEVESKVSGQFQWLRPTEFSVEKLGVGQFHFLSEGLPLELLQPLWERLGQRIDLAGMLVANLAGTWTDTDAGPAAEASGSVSLRSLSCAAPRILGDRVRLDHADAELAIKIADGMLDLGDVKVQSDLFGVQLTGKLPLQELSLEGILATLLDPKSLHYYKVRIALDLRKLAGTMPHVLRLRPGTDVESGQVQATVESIADLQGRHLKLDMTAEQLAASFEGQRFAWSQPLDLKLDALSHGPSWRQLQVNSLRCVAPFFEAEAQGDHRAGTLRLTGNLSQWQQELSRFVELPQQELQGTVLSQSAWEIQADGLTRATSRVTLQDFVYRAAESLPIEERLLTIDADLQARADDSGVHELAWGKFAVVAMDDQLRLEVTQPVGSPSLQAAYPVRGELHGDLTRWMARLQPWTGALPWQLRGQVQTTFDGIAASEKWDISAIQMHIRDFQANGNGIAIQEPNVRIEGQLVCDLSQHQLTTTSLSMASSTVAWRAANLGIDFGAAPQATGLIGLRCDVGRLARVFDSSTNTPANTPAYRLAGQFNGQVNLQTSQGVTNAVLQGDVDDFAVIVPAVAPNLPSMQLVRQTSAAVPVWNEPKIGVLLQARYDNQQDTATIDNANLTGRELQVQARGRVDQCSKTPLVDANGQLQYNLDALSAKFSPLVGNSVRLSGTQAYDFALKGPLLETSSLTVSEQVSEQAPNYATVAKTWVPTQLTAKSGVGWSRAEFFGTDVGPLNTVANLANGVVTTDQPVDLAIAGGRLRLQPLVDLNAVRPMMSIVPGTVADRVAISPEMCRSWIKYVAPLLANATSADGLFSVSLSQASVPVDEPLRASVSGVFTIHQARVRPGPLAEQLAGTARQVLTLVDPQQQNSRWLDTQQSLVDIAEQNVEFAMADGRVFHRGLEMIIDGAAVRTQGWVALDQTMELVAEVPIRDEWIAKERLLAGLRGQTIQVPIHGTLTQPRLDNRALAELSRRMVGSAAGSLLQGELQKQLQKLLPAR